jgi:hypothetical protein
MKDYPSIEITLKSNFPDISPEELYVRVELIKHIVWLETEKNRTFRKKLKGRFFPNCEL